MSSTKIGKIAIYASGGTGISIASHFEKYRNREENNGYGQIVPTYIDTTMGDIPDSLPRESLYVFEHTDGAGKIRAEHAELIKDSIPGLLQKFTPGDINIVLSSASGGTGSTFAGFLTIELLKRNVPVIAITIGTRDSRLEIQNTIKTIESYEKAAAKNGIPVVMSYWQNDAETPREKVDEGVRELITRLSALFSRQHRRLDTTDLANWLNYNKVNPSITPRLVLLDQLNKDELGQGDRDVISVATLAKEGQDTSPGVPVEYQTVGYVVAGENSINLTQPLHFCVVDGLVPGIYNNLKKDLESFQQARRAKPSSKPVIDVSGDLDDDIVL